MTPTTKHWLTGVLRALTTGSTAGGSLISVDGLLGHHIVWREVLIVTLVPAALRLMGYLRRHPLPGIDIPDDFRDTTEMEAPKVELSQPVTMVPKSPEGSPDK
jgi:hypothetical protein